MRIQQTQNNDTNYVDVARTQLGAGFATTRKIAANNLVSIFGQPAPDPTTGLAGVSTRLSGFNETSDPNDPTNTFRTQEEYMNLVWAAQPSNVADPKRAAARLQWQNTVRVIDEILRQGRLDMGGQPNILNGEQVRIQLAQDNSRAYTFNLPGRFDRAFLQIGANDFDFGVDGAIDQASNQITTGLTNLTNAQSNLATHSVALTGFSSFYKDMATFYQSNADTIIKADMNQESNNLKALQTMQQITQAVMGINNQNEQGVTRLLY
jgi:flagellin-like hook-associated protein FlgL